MSVERDDQERPCLHCMMLELIEDFFAEYPAASGEPDVIDTDEVVTAIAKTVAELTCGQDGTIRQQLIEQLMREIIDYDAEFRRDAGSIGAGRPLPRTKPNRPAFSPPRSRMLLKGDEGGLGGHYPLGHLRRGGGSISALRVTGDPAKGDPGGEAPRPPSFTGVILALRVTGTSHSPLSAG